MKRFMTIDGISSTDFGVYLAAATQFDSPMRDVEVMEVPGRNGSLTLDNGRFKNKEHRYTVYTQGNIAANIEGFRGVINQTSGYRKIKDSFYPDEFVKARYIDEMVVDSSDRKGAAFELKFDRMPQRFKDDGEIPVPVSNGSAIQNRYACIALPVIRAYGTGTLTINGVAIQITAADSYTDIDCELEEAYKDTLVNSKNSYLVLTNNKFPVLNPGSNAVTYTGFSSVTITPRWWTI